MMNQTAKIPTSPRMILTTRLWIRTIIENPKESTTAAEAKSFVLIVKPSLR